MNYAKTRNWIWRRDYEDGVKRGNGWAISSLFLYFLLVTRNINMKKTVLFVVVAALTLTMHFSQKTAYAAYPTALYHPNTIEPTFYVVPTDPFSFSDWITNVTFAGINNTTAHPSWRNNYSGTTHATVVRGQTYQLSVGVNSAGADFSYQYIFACVDWNNNGDCAGKLPAHGGTGLVAGEFYFLGQGTGHANPLTINITVPNDAALGTTWLRVTLKADGLPAPTDSYLSYFGYGEIEEYAIDVTAANSAPTDISLSASSINENVAANSTVGTLISTDPDAGNTFTYTLVSGTGSTDNASFTISGSSLRITSSPDFETKSSYSVRIRTTDQGGQFVEKAFTISINNLNEAPTFVGVTTALAVNQNSSNNDIKSLLHVSDPDASQTETWTQSAAPSHGTLSFSSATASSGSADITPGGTITYTPTTGYSGPDSFTIQVSDGTATATRTITVTVNPMICTPSCVHGACTSPNVCSCDPGFSGTACDIPVCFGVFATNPSVCGGHGTCAGPDTCVCATGYSGAQCTTFSCNGISATDPSVCSGYGICSSPDTCLCNSGFIGSQCANVQLTVGISGNGSVTSSNGTASYTCSSASCADAVFSVGDSVSLTATADPHSTFSTWSGSISSNINPYTNLLMDSGKSVTAGFSPDPTVKVFGLQTPYYTIGAGLAAAIQDGEVQAQAGNFAETCTMTNNLNLKLRGGYDADFVNQPDYSTISGWLKVKGGKLVVERLRIKSP